MIRLFIFLVNSVYFQEPNVCMLFYLAHHAVGCRILSQLHRLYLGKQKIVLDNTTVWYVKLLLYFLLFIVLVSQKLSTIWIIYSERLVSCSFGFFQPTNNNRGFL